jgi:hypothetical protein
MLTPSAASNDCCSPNPHLPLPPSTLTDPVESDKNRLLENALSKFFARNPYSPVNLLWLSYLHFVQPRIIPGQACEVIRPPATSRRICCECASDNAGIFDCSICLVCTDCTCSLTPLRSLRRPALSSRLLQKSCDRKRRSNRTGPRRPPPLRPLIQTALARPPSYGGQVHPDPGPDTTGSRAPSKPPSPTGWSRLKCADGVYSMLWRNHGPTCPGAKSPHATSTTFTPSPLGKRH